MHLWKLFRFEPFYSPDDLGGSAGGGSELSQDLADLSGEGDEQPEGEGDDREEGRRQTPRNEGREGDDDLNEGEENPEEGEEQPEGEESDEEGADDEEGDEEEEPEEEEEPDAEGDGKKVRVEGKPTIEDIKKIAGNDVFKYLPGLRGMVFEHKAMFDVFSDVETAKEASEKAGYFDEIKSSLEQGDPRTLLTELKADEHAFKQVATNFLPTLRELDPNLYIDLTLPIIEELLFRAGERAKSQGLGYDPTTKKPLPGQNLKLSAEWIADFVFGKPEIPDIAKRQSQEKHPAEIQLEKERRERDEGTRRSFSADVNRDVDKSLRGMITENLDPRLSKFERTAVIERVLDELAQQVNKDQPFVTKIKGLWGRAKTARYSAQSKDAIVAAHTSRAKAVVKDIRNRIVQEALGPRARQRVNGHQQASQDGQRNQQPRKRQFGSHGRPGVTRQRVAVPDSSKIDWARTSDADILADKGGDRIKLKGQRR